MFTPLGGWYIEGGSVLFVSRWKVKGGGGVANPTKVIEKDLLFVGFFGFGPQTQMNKPLIKFVES